MKLQNILMSAAMLAMFVLATMNLVIGLVQRIVEVTQTILATTLFIAKIACKVVKNIRQVLNRFDWLLSMIEATVDTLHSSLEDWMISTVPIPTNDDRPTPSLNAKSFPSERTAFEKVAIASLELISHINQQSATNSLELLPVAPTKTLMLPSALTIPPEKNAFEYHAISAITSSLELAVAEPESTIKSLEAIVEAIVQVTTEPLGKVITIGKTTELIPLSLLGVYVQRTPKKKRSKSELSKLTVPKLRELIAESNSSVAKPKKSAKKSVLVDWLLAN
jgi:hypothetical protein